PSHGRSRERLRLHADPRTRRLGTRLLPELPEQAPRLCRRFLERGELGLRGRTFRRGEVIGRQPRHSDDSGKADLRGSAFFVCFGKKFASLDIFVCPATSNSFSGTDSQKNPTKMTEYS